VIVSPPPPPPTTTTTTTIPAPTTTTLSSTTTTTVCQVLFNFPGKPKEEMAVVLRIDVDEDNPKEMVYDLQSVDDVEVVKKWVKVRGGGVVVVVVVIVVVVVVVVVGSSRCKKSQH